LNSDHLDNDSGTAVSAWLLLTAIESWTRRRWTGRRSTRRSDHQKLLVQSTACLEREEDEIWDSCSRRRRDSRGRRRHVGEIREEAAAARRRDEPI